MIYLATPYSNDKELNYYWACELLRKLMFTYKDIAFYSPIAQWHPIAKKFNIDSAFASFERIDTDAIKTCSYFYYCAFPGHKKSIGMHKEVKIASRYNKEIALLLPALPFEQNKDYIIANNLPIVNITILYRPTITDFINMPE